MDKRQLSMDKETGDCIIAKSRADANLAQETKKFLPTFHINLWISGNCQWTKRQKIGGDAKRDTKLDIIRETELYCKLASAKETGKLILDGGVVSRRATKRKVGILRT